MYDGMLLPHDVACFIQVNERWVGARFGDFPAWVLDPLHLRFHSPLPLLIDPRTGYHDPGPQDPHGYSQACCTVTPTSAHNLLPSRQLSSDWLQDTQRAGPSSASLNLAPSCYCGLLCSPGKLTPQNSRHLSLSALIGSWTQQPTQPTLLHVPQRLPCPCPCADQALLHPLSSWDPIQAPCSSLHHVPQTPRSQVWIRTPPPPLHLQVLWTLTLEHLEISPLQPLPGPVSSIHSLHPF